VNYWEATINGVNYPVAQENGRVLWETERVAEDRPEEWTDWSRGLGEHYIKCEGFDATTPNVLRLSPFYHNDNNPTDLTTARTCTYDDVTTATVSAAASTSFTSHTVASQDNRVGFVTVVLANGGPTEITWAGREMVLVASAGSPTNSRVTVWMIHDPPTGTSTIAVTFNGSVTGDLSSLSFYGVDDEIPTGDIVSATGNDTTPTVTAVTTTGEIVFDVVGQAVDSNPTVGANQTERWDTSGGSAPSACGSTQAGADGGAMTWTITSGPWTTIAVPVKPRHQNH
jgi:hypothetical protein